MIYVKEKVSFTLVHKGFLIGIIPCGVYNVEWQNHPLLFDGTRSLLERKNDGSNIQTGARMSV
jgi:hypothetical protein